MPTPQNITSTTAEEWEIEKFNYYTDFDWYCHYLVKLNELEDKATIKNQKALNKLLPDTENTLWKTGMTFDEFVTTLRDIIE